MGKKVVKCFEKLR